MLFKVKDIEVSTHIMLRK